MSDVTHVGDQAFGEMEPQGVYAKPQLIVYGAMAELTAGGSGFVQESMSAMSGGAVCGMNSSKFC